MQTVGRVGVRRCCEQQIVLAGRRQVVGVRVLDGEIDVRRGYAGFAVVPAVLSGRVLAAFAEHDRRLVVVLFRQCDVAGVVERHDARVGAVDQIFSLCVGDATGVFERSTSGEERHDEHCGCDQSAKVHGEKDFLREGCAAKLSSCL